MLIRPRVLAKFEISYNDLLSCEDLPIRNPSPRVRRYPRLEDDFLLVKWMEERNRPCDLDR
jgi:hypothetical protein